MLLKFIVVADTHIVPEGAVSHGLDTLDRLNRAVGFVNDVHADAEFVVFAGDLADHGEAAAYERFKAAIAPLKPPTYLTLGNHDDRVTFLKVFDESAVSETGNLDHLIDVKGYRVIVLDSSHPGLRGAGRLEESQLSWLRARLEDAGDRPVVVVLHHNITPFHVQTDFIILENHQAFLDVVAGAKNVRHVISGHVHMTTTGTVKGVPFSTLAGAHYSIEPTLTSRSGPVPGPVTRRDGPGQLAVVLCDDHSVVVHMENFIDRNEAMSEALFSWS